MGWNKEGSGQELAAYWSALCQIILMLRSLFKVTNLQAYGDEEEAPVGKTDIQRGCKGWVKGTKLEALQNTMGLSHCE